MFPSRVGEHHFNGGVFKAGFVRYCMGYNPAI